MSYKITIEETKEVTKWARREWKQGVDPANGEHGFGYTPMIENIEIERRNIYEQTVEELDLVAVIATINNIQRAR